MKLTKITAVALALLVVGAGAVAAFPGQAADQAQDHANDNANDAGDGMPADAGAPDDLGNASDAADNASDANANASERRGPPTDMPEPVPDHVSQIHETINSWLDGDTEGSLGEMISDIVGGDGAADENADGQADETSS
jgi:hypothetical protein